MITRKGNTTKKRGRVKVGELKLNKYTVKDLTGGEQRKIRGGVRIGGGYEDENTCGDGNCNTVCNGPTLCNGCSVDRNVC